MSSPANIAALERRVVTASAKADTMKWLLFAAMGVQTVAIVGAFALLRAGC